MLKAIGMAHARLQRRIVVLPSDRLNTAPEAVSARARQTFANQSGAASRLETTRQGQSTTSSTTSSPSQGSSSASKASSTASKADTSQSSLPTKSETNNTGLIIGVVAAIILIFVIAGTCLYYWRRHGKTQEDRKLFENTHPVHHGYLHDDVSEKQSPRGEAILGVKRAASDASYLPYKAPADTHTNANSYSQPPSQAPGTMIDRSSFSDHPMTEAPFSNFTRPISADHPELRPENQLQPNNTRQSNYFDPRPPPSQPQDPAGMRFAQRGTGGFFKGDEGNNKGRGKLFPPIRDSSYGPELQAAAADAHVGGLTLAETFSNPHQQNQNQNTMWQAQRAQGGGLTLAEAYARPNPTGPPSYAPSRAVFSEHPLLNDRQSTTSSGEAGDSPTDPTSRSIFSGRSSRFDTRHFVPSSSAPPVPEIRGSLLGVPPSTLKAPKASNPVGILKYAGDFSKPKIAPRFAHSKSESNVTDNSPEGILNFVGSYSDANQSQERLAPPSQRAPRPGYD